MSARCRAEHNPGIGFGIIIYIPPRPKTGGQKFQPFVVVGAQQMLSSPKRAATGQASHSVVVVRQVAAHGECAFMGVFAVQAQPECIADPAILRQGNAASCAP